MTLPAPCIALAISVFLTATAGANPTGPQVVNGNVFMQSTNSNLQLINSPNAVNWQRFAIGVNEIPSFVNQTAAGTILLNRVVGPNPSSVLDSLKSNGRVFLINPDGVLFGSSTPQSPMGRLEAGKTVELVDPSTPNLRVEIKAPPNQSLDLGQITGNVQRNGIYGGLVNQSGAVTADHAVIGADGRIFLKGAGSVPASGISITAPVGN
jgi:filamentous hemagglutinin family protein